MTTLVQSFLGTLLYELPIYSIGENFLTQLTLICNPRKFSTAELAFGHAEGVVISDLFVAGHCSPLSM